MSPARPRLVAALKQLAPWLIAAIALGWVLWKTNLHQMADAFRHAPIALFLGFSAFMLLLNLAADTFAMNSVFRWFGCRVPYLDLLLVRGSTYLVAVVNYHVGQAAIVGYLYRARKIPFLRATGWILFIIGINVGTLFLLASAGASRADESVKWLRLVPLVCAGGVVFYGTLLVVKPRALTRIALLAPLFEMGLVGHIKGVLVRLPHVSVLLVWHYVSLHMFGIPVTPLAALLYLPAYFAAVSLPINVNGLGAAQLVAIAFFSKFAIVAPGTTDVAGAQKAAVMAYSLGTSGVSILSQIVLGLACLKRGAALGMGPAVEVEVSPPEPEPAREATS